MDESFQLRAKRLLDGSEPAPLDFALLTATLAAQAAASAAARAQARAAPPPAEPIGEIVARRIGLEGGGVGAARLFQPCRSETPAQSPVKHVHREIYLGVLAFLQCSAAKGWNAGGAWEPKAREV